MLGVSDSNLTMKFVQLHYFLSQNIGGEDILSPVHKLWGTYPSDPLQLGPWLELKSDIYLRLRNLACRPGVPTSRSRSTGRSLNAWQSIAGDFMHV